MELFVILSWIHVRFLALRNDSFLGGSQLMKKGYHSFRGFGFWPSDDDGSDHYMAGAVAGNGVSKVRFIFQDPIQ